MLHEICNVYELKAPFYEQKKEIHSQYLRAQGLAGGVIG
jgi:hypothetical protein